MCSINHHSVMNAPTPVTPWLPAFSKPQKTQKLAKPASELPSQSKRQGCPRYQSHVEPPKSAVGGGGWAAPVFSHSHASLSAFLLTMHAL